MKSKAEIVDMHKNRLVRNPFHVWPLSLAMALSIALSIASPIRADPSLSSPGDFDIAWQTAGTGRYLLAIPRNLTATDRPPLIVALHGTETDAQDILRHWLSLEYPIPFILIAPQSAQPGWRDDEAILIHHALTQTLEQHHPDETRILLAGHSAGGAMAFHLVYQTDLPVTHVATTANYLPVHITKDRIRQRNEIPIFFGVGRRDLNRDRMRASVNVLHASGAQVAIERPDIGHVLDRNLTQQAMNWFHRRSADQTNANIHRALQYDELEDSAMAVRILESITIQSRWHAPAEITEAQHALRTVEKPGVALLNRAGRLADLGRIDAAARLILKVEKKYIAGALADRARALRHRIAPDFAEAVVAADASPATREDQAERLLLRAINLTAKRKFFDAKMACRRVLDEFAETNAVAGANRLLGQLDLAPTQ
jgi:poly(3-hydroxybutyrate) depolymerase